MVLRFVGAVFLVWLAWCIATAQPRSAETAAGCPMTFLEAALFQRVDPKASLLAVTAVATYTTVGDRTAIEIPVILAISLLVTVGSTITWTGFGFCLNRFLQESPRMLWAFNLGMALLLLLSIARVAT